MVSTEMKVKSGSGLESFNIARHQKGYTNIANINVQTYQPKLTAKSNQIILRKLQLSKLLVL